MRGRKIRLCIIVNPSIGLYGLYRTQWLYWLKHGYEVHAIAGPGPEHDIVRRMGVITHVIAMERYPSPLKDFVSLIRIWWFLLWNRFDIVHVSTPKAGFLGAIAARISGHSRLIYTLRGRPYENMVGWRRKTMNACEWTVCHLARRVIPICRELGDKVVEEHLCPQEKIRFIGSGSSNGVDLERFSLTKELRSKGFELRKELGIGKDDLVLLSVGWLRKEKGTNETVYAFKRLADEFPRIHLILLGQCELPDPLDEEVVHLIENHERIHHLPWQIEPAPVYAGADIFVFPSYREGLGNVALEAAAMELPVVTTDIIGCREAVKKDVTGLLVPCSDVEAIRNAIRRLIDDAELRKKLGRNGRRRIEQEFRQEIVWQGIHEQYRELLAH